MGRLKQIQIIDDLIKDVREIAKSQCSPSAQDLKLLEEAIMKLELLKRKKGRTNKELHRESVAVIEVLLTFFKNESHE